MYVEKLTLNVLSEKLQHVEKQLQFLSKNILLWEKSPEIVSKIRTPAPFPKNQS